MKNKLNFKVGQKFVVIKNDKILDIKKGEIITIICLDEENNLYEFNSSVLCECYLINEKQLETLTIPCKV